MTQSPVDVDQLVPTLKQLKELEPLLERPDALLADAGCFSARNVAAVEAAGITPLIVVGRQKHHEHWSERFQEPAGPPEDTPVGRMRHRLKTLAGRAAYAKRKHIVEPIFGLIKRVMGFRQFSLRGIGNVQGEWNLVCLAVNLVAWPR